jgi:beta-glucosidase
MDDRFGTCSMTDAIVAGFDLEIPGPAQFRRQVLQHKVAAKRIKQIQLEDLVRAVLELINQAYR